MTFLVAFLLAALALAGGVLYQWPIVSDFFKNLRCDTVTPGDNTCVGVSTQKVAGTALWTVVVCVLLVWLGPNLWSILTGMFSGGGGGGGYS